MPMRRVPSARRVGPVNIRSPAPDAIAKAENGAMLKGSINRFVGPLLLPKSDELPSWLRPATDPICERAPPTNASVAYPRQIRAKKG